MGFQSKPPISAELDTSAQDDRVATATVVVIDSNPAHRQQMAAGLASFYSVKAFGDYRSAFSALLASPGAIVVIDEDIPIIGGLGVVERIRAEPRLASLKLIAVAAGNGDFARQAKQQGVSSILIKPFRRSVLVKTISEVANRTIEGRWTTLPPARQACLTTTLQAFNGMSDILDGGASIDYGTLGDSCRPLVASVAEADFKWLLSAIKGHDNYSYVHSLRVATLLTLFGHAIGLRGDDLHVLACGGLLHDVGKMAIPHQVLNKMGPLDDDERQVMQSHVLLSVGVLERGGTVPKVVVSVAAQHHEKLDGTGYPLGLHGKDLNELARMATIVDIFGALTDERCYKTPLTPEQALQLMKDQMGRHIDLHLVKLFADLFLSAMRDG